MKFQDNKPWVKAPSFIAGQAFVVGTEVKFATCTVDPERSFVGNDGQTRSFQALITEDGRVYSMNHFNRRLPDAVKAGKYNNEFYQVWDQVKGSENAYLLDAITAVCVEVIDIPNSNMKGYVFDVKK